MMKNVVPDEHTKQMVDKIFSMFPKTTEGQLEASLACMCIAMEALNTDIPKETMDKIHSCASISLPLLLCAGDYWKGSLMKELDRIVDKVLAYRPKPKTKAAKRRIRRKKRFSKG